MWVTHYNQSQSVLSNFPVNIVSYTLIDDKIDM